MMKAASRPASDLQGNSLRIAVLDGIALKKLSAEPNSSKFAIDAHNRLIEEIHDLSELPKLCSLDVSFNKLKSLKNVHTAKELRELKAYNNKIDTLRGLKANGNLEGLLVHENELDDLADDLLALVKLKSLWLNGNRLTRVQHLGSCRLLVHLDLSRNRLSASAAEGLDSLSSLEYLNLSGNQITAVGNLTHLTKLEELNLSSNRVATLDGGLLPANISVLRLNDNKLKSLQSFPPYLSKLNELYLQDNAITDVGENGMVAAKFPGLESLDLRNNRVRSVAQLKAALANCATLADLWIQDNPCCLSATYLLDVMALLPELKTLDNMTDTQLKTQMDALKSGAVTQDAVLAFVSRPMTPLSGRPGTPSARPGSASQRPTTPSSATSSRPATPDRGAPVFHQSSSRSGALLKVASPSELEKAHADVVERLEKMKAMLGRIGKGGSIQKEISVAARSASQSMPKTRSGRQQQPFRSAESTATKPEDRSDNQEPTAAAAMATLKKSGKRGVDVGTDPLDSLIGSTITARVATPEVITPRRGMETQTPREPVVVLPPAPMHMPTGPAAAAASRSKLADAPAMADNQSQADDSGGSPPIDGDVIEREMKQLLLQYATQPDAKDRLADPLAAEPQENDADDETSSESPRVVTNKTAQQREPPSPRSRQGYRSFRIPMRLRESAAAETHVQ